MYHIGSCCLNCEDRRPACHSNCKKYAEALEKYKEMKTVIQNCAHEEMDYHQSRRYYHRRRKRKK